MDHEEEEDPGYARRQKAIESLPVLPDDYGPRLSNGRSS